MLRARSVEAAAEAADDLEVSNCTRESIGLAPPARDHAPALQLFYF